MDIGQYYKAAEYRREAAFCLETARRVSLRDDQARMLEMAQRLFALAEDAEAKKLR